MTDSGAGFGAAALRTAEAVALALAKSRPGSARRLRPAKPGDPAVRRLAHELAGRLTGAAPELAEPDRLAAVTALGEVFAALGPREARALFSADPGPGPLDDPPADASLSPAAATAYRELFALCRAAGGTGPQDPAGGSGGGSAGSGSAADRAARFEEEYAHHVARAQARVQLFGLTFSQDRQDWPLDLAYISLAVSGAQLLEEPGPQTPVKAEVALNSAERVLLRGPAGSGKSTLVQWLALNAARSSFGPQLRDWNALIPFVLPLRSFNSPAGLPRPGDWLTATGVPLTAPEGWVEQLLSAGRALVLVDGVDEVPPRLRSRTESWLRELLTAYPAARFVVTTRPSAVPEDWLTAQGFSSLALLPMERDDVGAFITHWHDSARAEADGEGAAGSASCSTGTRRRSSRPSPPAGTWAGSRRTP